MKPITFLFILLLSLNPSSLWALTWTDLWLTPNQQAQQLMQKGHYAKAKALFERKDWQATAAYRAGDYKEAVQHYKTLKNDEAYYNQANALAHMGQYKEAIKAYDKALAINPSHQDALYNRRLILSLLKEDQKKSGQDKSGQDKSGQDKSGQDKSGQDKSGQDKSGQDKSGQDKSGQDKSGQDKSGQDKSGQDKSGQDKSGQDKSGQDKSGQDKSGQDKSGQDKSGQDKSGQDKSGQDKSGQDKSGQNTENETTRAAQEDERAKEQWLRLIPDDPGGLLREKFLRDHLRRQSRWAS